VLNGYDPEIIDEVRAMTVVRARQPSDPLTIRYLGRMSRDRIPRALVRAVDAALAGGRLERSALRFECYGDCRQLQEHVQREHAAIVDRFRFHDAVPYRRAIELMLTADYLLFAETSAQTSLSAQGVLTTKLFEYLACGRPILAEIAPETEAGRMIRRAGASHFVGVDSAQFEAFICGPAFGRPAAPADDAWVRGLSRASQAQQYLALLDAQHGADPVSWNACSDT